MRKLAVAPVLIAIVVLLSCVAASAQIRRNPNRVAKRQQLINGSGEADPQFGQRRNRPLGGQRGQGFPPLGGQGKLKPNQRQQLLRARVMQALGLTADQNARIRNIHVSHEDERIELGRRIRQARQALDRAIMNDRFNEAEVRRATDELVAAQGERVRLESRLRTEVRNVLTPDQVMRFHQLERELRREMKEQQREQNEQIGPSRPPADQDEFDMARLLLPVDDSLPD